MLVPVVRNDDDVVKDGSEEARLVVIGDLDLAANSQVGNAANGLFILNTFNWLAEREQLIEIEGKASESTSLAMTDSELTSVYLMVLVFMPGLAIIAGFSVFMRRRR